MNLVSYIRMSTDKQEDSPETQSKVIKDYCEKNNHRLIKTYQDLGKSGGNISGRAGLLQLIRDAEKKLFEGIIVYKLDRAFRDLSEQITTLRKLKDFGVQFISVTDPISEGVTGNLMVNLLGSINQFEREITGERIYHHNRELAKKGKWTGGSRPPLGYGYDKVGKKIYTIPEEVEVVKKVYEIFLDKQGSSLTAWELNSLGLKTKDGKTWSPDLVYNVLNNPFYCGRIRYGYRKATKTPEGKTYCRSNRDNYEVFQGDHEAIISDKMFNAVQDIYRSKNTYKKKSDRVYVFTGILKCAFCGGPVVGFCSIAGKKGYRCLWHTNRKHICRGQSKMEQIIDSAFCLATENNINMALKNTKNPNTKKHSPKKNLEGYLKKLEQKIERQVYLFTEGIYSEDTFTKERKKVLEEKAKLEGQIREYENISTEEHYRLLISFQDAYPFRWKKPLEYRNLIRSIVKEIYLRGEELIIYYKPFALPGWEECKKVSMV